MSYEQYGKIEYTDFNSVVGTSTTSTTGQLNAIWAVGNGNKGYGQTAVPQVQQYNPISYTDWANAVNKTTTIANHTNTGLANQVAAPTQGSVVTYNPYIASNITAVTNARLNAFMQGTSSSTSTPYNATWSSFATFTHTVTFASGDAARYFFNAGGQIALSFSQPPGSSIDTLFRGLALSCGTIVLSSPTSGTVSIADTPYNGITKVGGSGSATTLSTNTGYYALSTGAGTDVFKQLATGTPAGYVGSFITVNMKTNGTQGSNGDNGNVITITTTWDEIPNGLSVSSGTTTILTVRPPSTEFIANTWGTVTVLGSATGS